MIRISAKKLDLHSLENGQGVTILTGSNGIQMITGPGAGDVHVGFAVTGAGPAFLSDENQTIRWLNLEALAPCKMYRLEVERTPNGSTAIEFKDITPKAASPADAERNDWGVLGRLLDVRR